MKISNFFYNCLLFFLLIIHSNSKLKSKPSSTLSKLNPGTGYLTKYGCYQNKCFAYCIGYDEWWCWTNKRRSKDTKYCGKNEDCDNHFYTCVNECHD
jgi:hypothetical protein